MSVAGRKPLGSKDAPADDATKKSKPRLTVMKRYRTAQVTSRV